jgi:hypothetical protein
MLNSIQHLKNGTLKRVQGDATSLVFRVTLSYPVMLNLIQHLKDETLKQVQGDVEKKTRP